MILYIYCAFIIIIYLSLNTDRITKSNPLAAEQICLFPRRDVFPRRDEFVKFRGAAFRGEPLSLVITYMIHELNYNKYKLENSHYELLHFTESSKRPAGF